ncbi:MAG: glycosyltransferase family 4 protein [Gemmatimonadales bacterium]
MSRPEIIFVGAFPPDGSPIHGGNVSACRALMQSSLPDRAALRLVDSTQRSIPAPRLPVRAWLALGRFGQVVRLLSRRPDAILMFAGGGFSLIEKSVYAWWARAVGVRSLLFVRSGDVMDRTRRSRGYRLLARALFAGADRLLCQGDSWKRFFVDEFGYEPDRCPVIANWTATPDLLDAGAERQYRTGDTVRILFVGWLSVSKGLFELLEAFAALAARNPGLELHLAGDGQAGTAAKAWVAERGLEGRVTFHGWVSGQAKLDLFRCADVFALPSHHEGMPNALIEAMAAGLPSVVTPVGCVPDVATDGQDALFVPVGAVESLRDALGRLVSRADLREQIGRAARQRAVDGFTVERAVDGLMNVVTGLVERPVGALSEER